MSRFSTLLLVVIIVISIVTFGKPQSSQVRGVSTQISWWQTILDRLQGKPSWKTFSNEKYGYTLKYPSNWQAKDNSAENTREIIVTANDKSALVKINAYHDPTMITAEKVTQAVAAMKNKMKTDKNLRVTAFKDSFEGQIGGYIAQGYQKFGEEEWRFENRGLLATNDRILIMHGAVKPPFSAAQWKIVYEIMKDFSLDKNK